MQRGTADLGVRKCVLGTGREHRVVDAAIVEETLLRASWHVLCSNLALKVLESHRPSSSGFLQYANSMRPHSENATVGLVDTDGLAALAVANNFCSRFGPRALALAGGLSTCLD